MTNGKIQLETLTCPSCVAKIEAVLKQTDGVESGRVLFNSSKVKLTYDAEFVSMDEVSQKIEALGYHVLKSR